MNDDLLKRTEGGNYFDELLLSPPSLPNRRQTKNTTSLRNGHNTGFARRNPFLGKF